MLGAVDLIEGRTAVWLAIAAGVVTLAVQGLRYARVERLGAAGTLLSVSANLVARSRDRRAEGPRRALNAPAHLVGRCAAASTVGAPVRGVLTAVAIVVAVPALALVGWAATRDDDGQELGALLDRVVDAGAPGALIVVKDGSTVRVAARGFADRDAARPMRPDDRFRIGSVTKTFVAALVLRLVEEGRLRLDDPVERWLPGLVPGGRSITVRHLLSHTAGLPDYVEDPRLRREPERRWTPTELVSLALARSRERVPPGGAFAYSSTDYVLLGLIAEKAGGADLGDQLRDRLFEPLGLRRTSFEPGALHGDTCTATGRRPTRES